MLSRVSAFFTRQPAVACGILAFAIRAAVLLISWQGHGAWNLTPDSGRYLTLAEAVAEGRGMSLEDSAGNPRPEFLYLPAYPVWLAGLRSLAGESVLPTLILQGLATSFAGSVLCIAIAGMAGPAAALLAGILLAVDIQSVTYSNLVLTEALSVTFIGIALAALMSYARSPATMLAWITGMMVALAVFIRPSNIAMMAIAALGMVAAGVMRMIWNRPAVARSSGSAWRMLLHLGLMLGVASLPVLFWSAYNHSRTGMWFYSTSSDVILVKWQLAKIYSEAEGVSIDEAREQIASELDIESTYATMGVRPPLFRARARAFTRKLLAEHPAAALRVYLEGVARVAAQPDGYILQVVGRSIPESGLAAGAVGYVEAVGRRWGALGPAFGALYFLQTPYLGALWLLGLVGAIQGLRHPQMRRVVVVPILGAAIFVLISGGYPGEPRYRLPALPFLIVLASIGATWHRKEGAR